MTGRARTERGLRVASQALVCAAAVIAFGADRTMASERQHGAHVHGVGQLNVAVEGDEVALELISPGADIVGFEHAPASDEDRSAVAEAAAALGRGAALFVFPSAAACHLEEAEVESSLLKSQHDDHDHDDHEKHGHGEDDGHDHGDHEEHGHDDHDDHDHDEHEGHDHGEADDDEPHAEFHAHYHFHCDNPARLSHIDVKLFERFPSMRELEVQAISPEARAQGN